jgi:hypothetical protein
MAETIDIEVVDAVTVDVTSPAGPVINISSTDPIVNIDVVGQPGPAGDPGTTDHSELVNLNVDDHPQYFTEERGDARYSRLGGEIIQFPSPLSVWTIDIGYLCNIVVTNSAGQVVEPGNISYSGTSMQLTFSAPFSGTAYCF